MRKLLWDYKRAFIGLPFMNTVFGQAAKVSLFVFAPAATLYAISFRPFKRVFYDVRDSTLIEK
jgi:hypothetical protein